MKVYTARQAIFNRKKHVVAYELLYRDGEDNFFPDIDAHEATSKLISRTHLNTGLADFTSGKPALINFGKESLLDGLPLMLPKKQIMVEVLENVEPSDEVFEACKKLYHQGYHIALDDFVYKEQWLRFFKYTKLIKFDIMATPLKQIEPFVAEIKQRKNLKILAEKVETAAEYEYAKSLGFDYFQGYFFCKPELSKKRDVDGNPQILLKLYQEVLKDSLNLKRVSVYFEQDLNLSYKLLRFINSGVMPLCQEISSIKQALVYLGEAQVRKLIALLTTCLLSNDKPKELLRIAVIRAHFCELIAQKFQPSLVESAFLAGLFSVLDAILNRPMSEVVAKLPLSEEVNLALTKEKKTPLCIMLTAVKYYEQGSWHNTTTEASKVNMSYEKMGEFYNKSLKKCDEFENAL